MCAAAAVIWTFFFLYFTLALWYQSSQLCQNGFANLAVNKNEWMQWQVCKQHVWNVVHIFTKAHPMAVVFVSPATSTVLLVCVHCYILPKMVFLEKRKMFVLALLGRRPAFPYRLPQVFKLTCDSLTNGVCHVQQTQVHISHIGSYCNGMVPSFRARSTGRLDGKARKQ